MFRRSHSKAGEEPRYRRTAVALVTSPTIRRPGFCLCNGAGCRLRPGLRLPRPCKPWGAPSPRRARMLFLKARPRGEHAGLSALLPTPELPGGRRGGLGHGPRPPRRAQRTPLSPLCPTKPRTPGLGLSPGTWTAGARTAWGSHTRSGPGGSVGPTSRPRTWHSAATASVTLTSSSSSRSVRVSLCRCRTS